jgi:hypothetical protein
MFRTLPPTRSAALAGSATTARRCARPRVAGSSISASSSFARNARHGPVISAPGSTCAVRIVPSHRDLMIARHARAARAGGDVERRRRATAMTRSAGSATARHIYRCLGAPTSAARRPRKTIGTNVRSPRRRSALRAAAWRLRMTESVVMRSSRQPFTKVANCCVADAAWVIFGTRRRHETPNRSPVI